MWAHVCPWHLTFTMLSVSLVARLADTFVWLECILADGINAAVVESLSTLIHIYRRERQRWKQGDKVETGIQAITSLVWWPSSLHYLWRPIHQNQGAECLQIAFVTEGWHHPDLRRCSPQTAPELYEVHIRPNHPENTTRHNDARINCYTAMFLTVS